MISFNLLSKFLMFPLYYIFHYNIIFGWFHKKYIKIFKYRNFIFNLNDFEIPLPFHSSFIFKTYELNDRILLEKNLTKKHKCIIIGGGIGFVPTIANKLTRNKVLIFEINKKIINNLKLNLKNNKVQYTIFNNNLLLNNKDKQKYYYSSHNFLATSMYRKTSKKLKLNNLNYKKIKDLSNFNTLVIDGEGIEKHYIENIHVLKKIKYIFFEFHNDIFSNIEKEKIFKILNKKKFFLKNKFINSYYFIKSSYLNDK